MKSLIKTTIIVLLILLFTYAASSKLLDIERFRAQLYLQPFSQGLSDLLVYTLPAIEIITALMLCLERFRLAGLLLTVALMAIFTGYISMALLHYWGNVPCSCGGILEHMSWSVHLAFNWAFLIAGITAIALHMPVNRHTK